MLILDYTFSYLRLPATQTLSIVQSIIYRCISSHPNAYCSSHIDIRPRFQEAIRYYEPIVKKQADSILEVPAIVLANLCVSHIMISQNEEAEELMRKVYDRKFACIA